MMLPEADAPTKSPLPPWEEMMRRREEVRRRNSKRSKAAHNEGVNGMHRILAAVVILSTSSAAWAQRQPTSCSAGAQMCKEGIGRARDPTRLKATTSDCDAAAAQCMKTGVYVGPDSGVRWPVAKN